MMPDHGEKFERIGWGLNAYSFNLGLISAIL